MNKLIALAAAGLAALLVSRRKTLKDDGKRVTAGVKDRASNLAERVRGGSDSDQTIDEDVIDLSDDEPVELAESGQKQESSAPAEVPAGEE